MIHCPVQRGLVPWVIGVVLPVAAAIADVRSTTIVEKPYRLERWTGEDGVPHNTVNYLAQTPDGYVWAGTRVGVARFDGVRFTVFSQELGANGQGDLSCRDMDVDGQGRLWIRLPDALVSYFNGRFERFSIQAGPLRCNIQTIIASRHGGLWIGTSGEGLKRLENGSFTRVFRAADGLETDWIGLLNEDGQGRIWIGCRRHNAADIHSWQRLNPVNGEWVHLRELIGFEGNVWDVYPDRHGGIWATMPGQLIRWADGKLTRYDASAIWGSEYPGRIQADHNGALWLAPGNSGKAARFENGRFEVFNLKDQFPIRDIRCLFPDREGNVWVGTGAQGLLQVQPRRMESLLTRSSGGGNQEIYSVAAGTRDGMVWLTAGSTLLRFHQRQVESFAARSDGVPPSHVQAALEDRSGQVWVKAYGGLFHLADGRLERVADADLGRSKWTATALHEDRRGRLWIGSDSGLVELREGQFVLHTTDDGLSDDDIRGIRDAPDGSLWLGTKRGGLNRFKDGRFNGYAMRDGLLSNWVWPLRIEEDGTVWAGTPAGLNRIRAGEIRAVTERQGLLHNEVYSLLDDGRGHYWGHCNRGIFRVPRANLHAVADGRQRQLRCMSYGEADGMASTEGNGDGQPSAALLPDGRMWFPMTRGVVVFDPGEVMETDVPPTIVIEQVEADDEVVYGDGLGRPMSEIQSPMVKLSAGRARWLKIHYTANSFLDPRRVRFQYRLVGHDRDWRKVTDERVAYYADLKPGRYQFEVKAANPHGVWNETPATIALSLAPYFWQTWPFYTLCGAALMAAAGGIVARRLRGQRRLLRLEHQRAMEQERTRLARDLHDELGTALTGLALEMELARRSMDEAAVASGRLQGMADQSRALAARMREVVWAISPRCDDVPGLATFLEQHAAPFVEAAGLRCRLEFPESLPALPLAAEARHQLALGVREALTNVVRHARAREVVLSMRTENGALIVLVCDDGVGFDPARLNGTGHGLANLRSRLEPLGGMVNCQSSPGSGTTVTFRLPLARRPG